MPTGVALAVMTFASRSVRTRARKHWQGGKRWARSGHSSSLLFNQPQPPPLPQTMIHREPRTPTRFQGGGRRGKIVAADIPSLLTDLTAPGVSNQYILLSARGYHRMLTCESNHPVKQVLESSVLPLLKHIPSQNDYPVIQFEASWDLTNVASTYMKHTVVERKGVPQLVALLNNRPNAEIREQSAWCLGNITGDCLSLRDQCLAQGSIEPFRVIALFIAPLLAV